MLILASALKNPSQPLIPDAAVWIQGEKIRWAGPRQDLPAEAKSDPEKFDLENTLLIPGMINAHAHLELTDLKGLPYPGSFSKWIRAILAAREISREHPEKSGIAQGVKQLLSGGTTTVADHIGVTGDLTGLLKSPLRGIAFVEVLGVNPEVAWDILEAALLLEEEFGNFSPRWKVVPSPHSVHALHPDVLESLLHRPHPLFSIHLAESEEEADYFEKKSGPLFKLIAERGSALQRQEASGLKEIQRAGRKDSRVLVIHGNYLDEAELRWLAETNSSVVHCPLSHRYFSHRPFPMERFLDLNINLALGTDSLASAASLSMFDVLRTLEGNFPGLDRERIFAMATLGGAKALKMENEIGVLAPGMLADLVGVPFLNGPDEAAAIFQAEDVNLSMIGGKFF